MNGTDNIFLPATDMAGIQTLTGNIHLSPFTNLREPKKTDRSTSEETEAAAEPESIEEVVAAEEEA